MRPLIFAILLSLCVEFAHSQALLGTTGWLNIPTAEMQEDGTFFAGGSFINKNYIANYGDAKYNLATYYFNLTFLPFLEVNFGNMRLLDNIDNNNTVDRRFTFRFRPLRERKYIPAVVIGAHDVYTSVPKDYEYNQYFSSLYIVLTKHFDIKKSEIAATLGYGINAFRNNRYIGFFGGVSFRPGFYRPLNLIVNYDAKE
ncbi:MAG TPA: YjbH domain-containing protein, partial [Bacteroidales bacterium]